MLLIPTEVKSSTINGFGLFAVEPIRKGTVVWSFTEHFDQHIPVDVLMTLPVAAQLFICRHGWKSSKSGMICFPSDECRFVNHSEESFNTESKYVTDQPEAVSIATRDISPGEELTENYDTFEQYDETNELYHLGQKYKDQMLLDPRLQ